jgi:hypothetical protein
MTTTICPNISCRFGNDEDDFCKCIPTYLLESERDVQNGWGSPQEAIKVKKMLMFSTQFLGTLSMISLIVETDWDQATTHGILPVVFGYLDIDFDWTFLTIFLKMKRDGTTISKKDKKKLRKTSTVMIIHELLKDSSHYHGMSFIEGINLKVTMLGGLAASIPSMDMVISEVSFLFPEMTEVITGMQKDVQFCLNQFKPYGDRELDEVLTPLYDDIKTSLKGYQKRHRGSDKWATNMLNLMDMDRICNNEGFLDRKKFKGFLCNVKKTANSNMMDDIASALSVIARGSYRSLSIKFECRRLYNNILYVLLWKYIETFRPRVYFSDV